jgi:hypothetical protein
VRARVCVSASRLAPPPRGSGARAGARARENGARENGAAENTFDRDVRVLYPGSN